MAGFFGRLSCHSERKAIINEGESGVDRINGCFIRKEAQQQPLRFRKVFTGFTQLQPTAGDY